MKLRWIGGWSILMAQWAGSTSAFTGGFVGAGQRVHSGMPAVKTINGAASCGQLMGSRSLVRAADAWVGQQTPAQQQPGRCTQTAAGGRTTSDARGRRRRRCRSSGLHIRHGVVGAVPAVTVQRQRGEAVALLRRPRCGRTQSRLSSHR